MMKATPTTIASVTLSADDVFKRSVTGTMAVRNCGAISWLATAASLYMLFGALSVIDGFEPFSLADYEARGPCAGAGRGRGTVDVCTLDAWAKERTREAAFGPPLQPPVLASAKYRYRLLAYAVALGMVVADGLRFFGHTSYAGELLLGWYSARNEKWRPASCLVLTLPLLHLAVLYTTAVEVELPGSGGIEVCCEFGPRGGLLESGPLGDRIKQLLFLFFVTGRALFADSHNHGYFLLRVPDVERSARLLIRDALGKQESRSG